MLSCVLEPKLMAAPQYCRQPSLSHWRCEAHACRQPTVDPGRNLPVSFARKFVASVTLKLEMETSPGPPIVMSSTQMRSQMEAATEKKRHAPVLQR
eukprot:2967969-Alexandrium_andersonii.AAC.1